MRKVLPKGKIVICMILACMLVLSGCQSKQKPVEPKGMTYFDYFDTVSYIFDYRGDEDEIFNDNCKGVAQLLYKYHRLFDIYHEFEGVTNLCTINKNAGKQPLVVDRELIDFLLYAKELYVKTNGEMNVMMGAVLTLWHDARETAKDNPDKAYVPSETELQTASQHTSIDLLEIDEVNNTVFISDPLASIDVGALGKGYATEIAGQYLLENNCIGYVLNIGGNIRIIGQRPNGDGWTTGIKDPLNKDEFAIRVYLKDTACVTSGNYERFFVYGNQKYHHIIDKDTLYPATYYSSVTIITEDSGLADSLSTALFCVSIEEGKEMIKQFNKQIDVIWIDNDGNMTFTDGIEKITVKD